MGRTTLLIMHILLIVAWLGIDVGVFTASFLIRKRGLSADARIELRRLMRGLDLAPRLSLVLTMPVALGLADVTGYASVPAWLLWTVSAAALAWAGAIVWAFQRVTVLGTPRRGDVRAARTFRSVDLALRLVAIIGFGVAGVGSLLGLVDTFAADFVALKSTLFASTVLAGIAIRQFAGPFTPALRTVIETGETTQAMAVMDRTMKRVYPAVLYIWGSLVVMVVIGVARPTFG